MDSYTLLVYANPRPRLRRSPGAGAAQPRAGPAWARSFAFVLQLIRHAPWRADAPRRRPTRLQLPRNRTHADHSENQFLSPPAARDAVCAQTSRSVRTV